LIGNSIDLTLVKGHVEVLLKDSSNKIIVEIHNDGPSIESCKMNKVLNGFKWITEQSDWRPEQDRTLSLSIAKKIIELQGGWIWMEKSENGIGNNFCISLPKTCADKRLSMAAKDAEISSNIESNE
jgi:signal transduction histidine kinase